MNSTGHFLQICSIITPLLLIAAIITVGVSVNIPLAIILALLVHSSQKSTGGWFFAWKKKNRDSFSKNWEDICS